VAEVRNARSSVRVAFQGASTIVRVAEAELRVLNRGGGELHVAAIEIRVLVRNELRNARSSVRVAFQGATTFVQLAEAELRVLTTGAGTLRVGGAELRVLSPFVALPEGPTVMVYTGTEFVLAPVELFDGRRFVDAEAVETWDGDAWSEPGLVSRRLAPGPSAAVTPKSADLAVLAARAAQVLSPFGESTPGTAATSGPRFYGAEAQRGPLARGIRSDVIPPSLAERAPGDPGGPPAVLYWNGTAFVDVEDVRTWDGTGFS
jgi:hypothetical protein